MNRAMITELVGTFFLCLAAALSMNPLVIGALLAVLTYTSYRHSGAFFNPALTAAGFLRGRLGMSDAMKLMAAQGAAALAAIVLGLVWQSKGSNLMGEMTGKLFFQLLLGEAFGAFLLAYVYFSVTDGMKAEEGNHYFGLAIGLAAFVIMSIFSTGSLSIASQPVTGNPIIALVLALLGKASGLTILTSLLGSVVGAVGAAFFLKIQNGGSASSVPTPTNLPPT